MIFYLLSWTSLLHHVCAFILSIQETKTKLGISVSLGIPTLFTHSHLQPFKNEFRKTIYFLFYSILLIQSVLNCDEVVLTNSKLSVFTMKFSIFRVRLYNNSKNKLFCLRPLKKSKLMVMSLHKH